MRFVVRIASMLTVAVLPLSAAAAPTFSQLVSDPNYGIVHFINTSVMPLLYAFAFLTFLFGIFRFFFNASDEARQKGKAFVLWGIIGFVVLFSVWSIVSLLLNTLNLGN